MRSICLLCALTLSLFPPCAVAAADDLEPTSCCKLCYATDGPPSLDCSPDPVFECEDVPQGELVDEDPEIMPPVQALIARAIVEHWGALAEVFENPYRIYVPREAWLAVQEFPGSPAGQIRRVAQIRFRRMLIREARGARLEHVETGGTRGKVWTLRSSDALLTFVIRLLRDDGALTDTELASLGAELELGRELGTVERPSPADTDSEAFKLFRAFVDALRRDGADELRLAVEVAVEVLR